LATESPICVCALIKPGIRINEPELLFTKIEDSEIEFQLEKLRKSKIS